MPGNNIKLCRETIALVITDYSFDLIAAAIAIANITIGCKAQAKINNRRSGEITQKFEKFTLFVWERGHLTSIAGAKELSENLKARKKRLAMLSG